MVPGHPVDNPRHGEPARKGEPALGDTSALGEVDIDPWLGRRIDGRYTLEQVIGEGGTGRVYRARQEATGREVAVKLLRSSLLHDEASVRRFQREARAACRINHQNAITVHDFGFSPDGQCYLVTELIEGETLRAALDRDGPMQPERALELFSEIVAGVAAAHDKGVVHRELHPGTVFLCRGDHGEEHVKVFDFGGARLLDSSLDTDVTGVGQLDLRQLLHSIRYLPPERMQRNISPDPRGDVYSLGLILFELCTGAYPFDSADPLQVMAMHLHEPPPLLRAWAPDRQFSPALQGLVTSMLAKDPAQRPADATEVAERLFEAQDREALMTTAPEPEPDFEVEMVALPADEEEGLREQAPPASGRRQQILVSMEHGQEEMIGKLPTLPDYGDVGDVDRGPRGVAGQGARLPYLTQIDLIDRPGARVTAVTPEPASLQNIPVMGREGTSSVSGRRGRYRRLIIAAICVCLGAGIVFAAGTAAYRFKQAKRHSQQPQRQRLHPAPTDSVPVP